MPPLNEEEREVSWHQARYRLLMAGLLSSMDAPPEEVARVLVARGITSDADVRAMHELVGADGVYACREALGLIDARR